MYRSITEMGIKKLHLFSNLNSIEKKYMLIIFQGLGLFAFLKIYFP